VGHAAPLRDFDARQQAALTGDIDQVAHIQELGAYIPEVLEELLAVDHSLHRLQCSKLSDLG
jgi:hypothetical protein